MPRTSTSPCRIQSSSTLHIVSRLDLTTKYHVSTIPRTIYQITSVAEAVDGATCQLVRQCTRIQKAWIEVSLPPHLLSSVAGSLLMARRADDLIPEENDTVQLALKRLPPKEAYDRVFRLRRAFQVQP
jgi:hypothetical protein